MYVNGNFKWIKLRYDFLDPSFVYDTEKHFNLKQVYSSTGRDFLIQDQKGNPFLRVDGIKSIRGNVKIYDVRDGADKHIFTLRPVLLQVTRAMYIIKANGDECDTVFQATFFNWYFSNYYIYRSEKVIYTISENLFGNTFSFYDDKNRLVAQSRRMVFSINGQELVCKPETDTLMCLIGMVCTEIAEQEKKAS